MTWARPVGIGFLVLAVLAGIAVRVEIGHESTSWLLITVYAVLGAAAALVGAGLMVVAGRLAGRR
ncbi:hypothetical protein ABT297_29355 [Dactylosporangium sp. NPDC000555]|uniref:hypothetical protein n=1 Tax=Dactylosporangium sp. NPDC000555 TaxID=3154260 RepID=UPI00332973BC